MEALNRITSKKKKNLIQVGFAYVIKYMKSFANPRNLKTFREATVSNEKLWRAAPKLLVSNWKTIRALNRLTHPIETKNITYKSL